MLKQYVSDLNNADVLVLGCTHYTLVKGLIQYYVGPDVKVIDSNAAVARQVLRVMQKENLENPQDSPELRFQCSGDESAFMREVERYIRLATPHV